MGNRVGFSACAVHILGIIRRIHGVSWCSWDSATYSSSYVYNAILGFFLDARCMGAPKAV